MKPFAIAPTFALFCGISAASVVKPLGFGASTPGHILSPVLSHFPIWFDGGHAHVEIKFGDLAKYYESDGTDPLDTFIFNLKIKIPVNSNSGAKVKHNLSLDFAPMREAVPNLALSFSGCDRFGIKCYPEYKNKKLPRVFQEIKSADTMAFLHTEFAGDKDGQRSFYVYLQVQSTPGKDNAARPPFDPKNAVDAPHSDLYNRLVNYKNPDEVALTFFVSGLVGDSHKKHPN